MNRQDSTAARVRRLWLSGAEIWAGSLARAMAAAADVCQADLMVVGAQERPAPPDPVHAHGGRTAVPPRRSSPADHLGTWRRRSGLTGRSADGPAAAGAVQLREAMGPVRETA
jgi:hypothetical protein